MALVIVLNCSSLILFMVWSLCTIASMKDTTCSLMKPALIHLVNKESIESQCSSGVCNKAGPTWMATVDEVASTSIICSPWGSKVEIITGKDGPIIGIIVLGPCFSISAFHKSTREDYEIKKTP